MYPNAPSGLLPFLWHSVSFCSSMSIFLFIDEFLLLLNSMEITFNNNKNNSQPKKKEEKTKGEVMTVITFL